MAENPLAYEKISKLLRSFAVPSITATLVSSLYNIVDQIFIGQGVGYLGNAATIPCPPSVWPSPCCWASAAPPASPSTWGKRSRSAPPGWWVTALC